MIQVFEAEICNLTSGEFVQKIHCIARDIQEASGIFDDFIFGEDSILLTPLEIRGVRRLPTIQGIINPEYALTLFTNEDIHDADGQSSSENEYDGSLPLEVAKGLSETEIITFKCGCHEVLTVPANMPSFLKCPNCQTRINRSELKNYGGIWVYEKKDNSDQRK